MQRGAADKSSDGVPDGWYRIPQAPPASNNAHPVTPPGDVAVPPSMQRRPGRAAGADGGPDSLGLAKAVDPMRMLLRETRVREKMMAAHNLTSSSAAIRSPRGAQVARSSPRHLKLVQKQANSTPASGDTAPSGSNSARRSFAAAEAFSPQRSLRLACLDRQPLATEKKGSGNAVTSSPMTRGAAAAAGAVSPPAPSASAVAFGDRSNDLPLHELIQNVDDAVDADPYVDSNQAAITQLFMAQWLAQFDASRHQFKSIAVHAEVGFQELYRLTANLPSPNELVTAFACKVLGDLAPHFGAYAPLLRVLRAELLLSAYCAASSLPYFAIVKNQKRLVLALRKDKKHRHERNEFLAHEIRKVHEMFRHFLDECSAGLVRTLFREWYSIAIIRKKNTKKYIEYFSAWFTASAKSLVPKLFATWKHAAVQRKMDKLHAQLSVDSETLSALQRQIDELSLQRDVTQVESLAIRNDRKQAEDMIQRLNRKIQSAGAYLEGSYRREGVVCQEGQLRVEAASFLPPLILESLLRGYHNVGFLQQLHNEFIPKQTGVAAAAVPQTGAAESVLLRKASINATSGSGEAAAALLARRQSSLEVAVATKRTVLQDCLAEIIRLRGTPLLSATASGTAPMSPGSAAPGSELSIQDFAKLFQSIQQRMDARNVHVIFTKALPDSQKVTGGAAIDEEGDNATDSDDEDRQDEPPKLCELAEEVASLYELVLHAIRAQDEHYARNAKLFSSRMLESHEVSVVPHLQYLTLSSQLHSDGEAGDGGSMAGLPPSMPSTLQNGDLGVINGAKRFSIANVCPVKMTPMQFDKPPAKTSTWQVQTPRSTAMASPPSNAALERLEFIRWSDFGVSTRHTRAFFMLFLTHLASEFGSLLFSPADMSAFMHNAYVANVPPPLAAAAAAAAGTAKQPAEDDQGFHNIVVAYEVWNRLAAQMIEAEIAQSRGGTALPTPEANAPGSADSSGDAATRRISNLASTGGILAIRPKLQLHIEPLPHGVLMTSVKEKESSTAHGGRLSLALGETFHTARIRRLSMEDTSTLTNCVENIHRVVKATSTRLHDFNVVRQQIRDFRHLQWEQASELASQFASPATSAQSTTATAAAQPTAAPAVFMAAASHLTDERKHVFECISFDNAVIERIFSIEENPNEELERVRTTLERKKHLVRHLYTKHRAHIQHAVSLDDLWHFVKVLRFPKEIHMLPAMRDEDMAANGYEQLFSPDDLAEILLQLCNEQFAPQIAPLSARVEYFARHHLPFAAQNQSIIRELMHEPDVKRALADHSQTLRIIFRRYCAKERDIGGALTSMTQQHHASGNHTKSNQSQQQQHRPVRHTSHGITKYMRLIDWLAFIQDYNLLRPRFPLDYAVVVFRNVQEVAGGGADGGNGLEEQQLEMIYSEFCEALVGVAACYFPDPFLKSATKVGQFIQRFLPVSPEEVCSHV